MIGQNTYNNTREKPMKGIWQYTRSSVVEIECVCLLRAPSVSLSEEFLSLSVAY